MENTTITKLKRRSEIFDTCFDELSTEAQECLTAMIKFISENGMQKGGRIDSAKELIIQMIRAGHI